MNVRRWPPVEVAIFFVVALVFQYWLFAQLNNETIPTKWFRIRFLFPIVLVLSLTLIFRGRAHLWALIAPLLKIPLSIRWWIFAIGWLPALAALTTLTYPLLPGSPGDAPPLRPGVLIPALPFLFTVIQISLADECAWIGFAYKRTSNRWVPLAACVLVGTVWGWWYQPMVGFGRAVAGTAIPVPLFIWTMIATAVACAVMFHATRSALIVVAAQASGNFFYLAFPVLPQATNSWFPYAVFCGYQLILTLILVWKFGPHLRSETPSSQKHIWLLPKRWRPNENL